MADWMDAGQAVDDLLDDDPSSSGRVIRLVAGLGEPEREQRILQALNRNGRIADVERCLSGDQLVACVEAHHVDAVLLADDLHRLSAETFAALRRSRVPLVVLSIRPDDPRWARSPVTVLPMATEPSDVLAAVVAAVDGGGWRPAERPDVEDDPPETTAQLERETALALIAVASGHGSPGRSFLALNLAYVLGAVAPTILVDADVSGPSLAAYLDLDPTRNLFMLAHAEPQTAREWDRAIGEETQPFGSRSPRGFVLCGIPKPEMRAGVSPAFFSHMLEELRNRYRYVVLDVGADLLGEGVMLHRLTLGASQQVLFVAAADLVGLWHARVGLATLCRSLDLDAPRVALIINRHQRRYHHTRTEIEWALGYPVAAVVPEDSARVQTALLAQTPVLLDHGSPAGRAILDLAKRIHGGTIVLPPEASQHRNRGFAGRLRYLRPAIPRLRPSWHLRLNRSVKEESLDGNDVPATP